MRYTGHPLRYIFVLTLRAFTSFSAAVVLNAFSALAASAQTAPPAETAAGTDAAANRAKVCPSCAIWNAAQTPFRVFGNTWYVGTHGLSALLVTSPNGHILIDGGLPESAALIAANIAALGFRMQDIKLIVNSHDHHDHAGGIAELQRLSGAKVAASASSARVLMRGDSESDDPQFGLTLPFPPAREVETIRNNQVVRAGDNAITARFTAGHTPGGTSWSWVSCQGTLCLNMVYADSQTPVSADEFFYTRSKSYTTGIRDFENGFRVLEQIRCDILVTPHPDASSLWQRVARRDSGETNALIDSSACQRYARNARERLATRIATERVQKK